MKRFVQLAVDVHRRRHTHGANRHAALIVARQRLRQDRRRWTGSHRRCLRSGAGGGLAKTRGAIGSIAAVNDSKTDGSQIHVMQTRSGRIAPAHLQEGRVALCLAAAATPMSKSR